MSIKTVKAGKVVNHYDWLEKHLPAFFAKLEIPYPRGIIVAHGDKCSSYKAQFERAGIPFEKGVALYLLTYCSPFSKESRETANGWVAPVDWIIANKDRFLPLMDK
jgi:hypothetical protein